MWYSIGCCFIWKCWTCGELQLLKIQVCWNVMPWLLVNSSLHFEGFWCLQNMRNCSPNDTVSHPRSLEAWATFLWEPARLSFVQYQQIRTDFIKLLLYESIVLSVVIKHNLCILIFLLCCIQLGERTENKSSGNQKNYGSTWKRMAYKNEWRTSNY